MSKIGAPQEFISLCIGIKESYPKSGLFENAEAITFWYKMLGDLPLDEITDAVARHIATSKFAPTIAEIREIASGGGVMEKDYSYGYDLMKRAISNYGSYREDEAMDWLRSEDETTAIVVKRLGFKNVCLSENRISERSHFKAMYENVQRSRKIEAQLPQGLRPKEDQKRLEENKKTLDGFIERIG